MLEHLPALNSQRIILASASPRRRELLQQIGLKFQVVESGFEENLPKTSAGEYAQRTALHKALDVARSMHGKFDLIIAADTVVQVGDRILEKPNDDEHAAEMLESLSGRRHQVCTGVVLLTLHGEPTSFVEMTDVFFASLTTAGIEAYIATGESRGKAGAYGIQGAAACFVERIEGCYNNVVGFPIFAFSKTVARLV
ncbi:Septum formation protein Maf, partial [Auxenochlorella protothecoides]